MLEITNWWLDGQIADLEFLRFAYTWLQPTTGWDSEESVENFMSMIGTAIGNSLTAIAGIEDSIEIQTQLVEQGIINVEVFFLTS